MVIIQLIFYGPTILFSRGLDGKKFYSCAAYRDKKKCSFFLWENQSGEKYVQQFERDPIISKMIRFKLQSRLKFVKSLNQENRIYCHKCNELLPKSEKHLHLEHEDFLQENIDDFKLSRPSQLLRPFQESKRESQYFFTDSTINAFLNMFKSLNIKYVVCIGAPTIHEQIVCKVPVLKSILLDIDHRYLQFYQCNDFRWFNLFNCYILEECDTKEILVDLLSKEDSMAVLIDPPFGGRLEPIAYTMKKFDDIRLKHNKNFLTKFLILPYFMERYVKSCLPEMSMLDYKVDYSNHKKFNDTGRNKGSPIRLFTNANQSKIPLPSDENYHFCEECNRWVSGENNHCYQCGGCMSKNGRKYIHCNLCKKCVKCTWKHCKKCKKCCLPDHRCINDQIKTSSKNKRQGQNKKYKSSINLKSTMIKKNIYNEEIKRF
ncbi:rRNA N6-adenosine-methyltransferase ZCCHC4-like isoform X2 [Daktulosphaira vitifoliae]|uniref:rRNA N6-adenosine-methyltransferase ZCCHC4-like isoform X2 n=1 Tax=Daktulosphaira vitifoliae TaxID=58002 RepID=UPI0021A9ADC0|nr:rRNA N6-adenosine-methyltransferase ZCCHC4-like isoform X2 [Daktulosphaira vitifoliae]